MSETPTHGKALLIGINSYPLLPGCSLEGCENDVLRLRGLLRDKFAFCDADIETLMSREATQANILAALERLIARVHPDEPAVLLYAGHGSRVPAAEADSLSGWHETLVPYDSGRDLFDNLDILDDQLRQWLLRLTERTRCVTMLLDCCHSGTLHRDGIRTMGRAIVRATPPGLGQHPATTPRGLQPGISARPAWLPHSDRYTVLAACRDRETAHEHTIKTAGGRLTHGALTYFLCETLQACGENISYRELFEHTSAAVTAQYGEQHPVCEGAHDRLAFSRHSIESGRYALVLSSTDEELILGVGQIHGVTVGSTWDVYGSPDGAGGPLGAVSEQVTVIHSDEQQSRARRHRPGRAVPQHSRAVETAWLPDSTVSVFLTALPAALRDNPAARLAHAEAGKAISRELLLRLTAEPASATVHVHILPMLSRLPDDLREPPPKADAALCYAIARPDGDLWMPLLGLGQSALLPQLLWRVARQYLIRLLESGPGAAPLAVDFLVLRQQGEGGWSPAQPMGNDPAAELVCEDGESLAFAFMNGSGRALYINLLYLDPAGAIVPIYPPPGGEGELRPAEPARFGCIPGQALYVAYPDEFMRSLQQEGRPAHAYLKLLVTTEPVDVRSLLQQSIDLGPRQRRGDPLATSPQGALAQRLASILSSVSPVRSPVISTASDGAWLAQTRGLRITAARRLPG